MGGFGGWANLDVYGRRQMSRETEVLKRSCVRHNCQSLRRSAEPLRTSPMTTRWQEQGGLHEESDVLDLRGSKHANQTNGRASPVRDDDPQRIDFVR